MVPRRLRIADYSHGGNACRKKLGTRLGFSYDLGAINGTDFLGAGRAYTGTCSTTRPERQGTYPTYSPISICRYLRRTTCRHGIPAT